MCQFYVDVILFIDERYTFQFFIMTSTDYFMEHRGGNLEKEKLHHIVNLKIYIPRLFKVDCFY